MYKIFFNNRAICIGDSQASQEFKGKRYIWEDIDSVDHLILLLEKDCSDIFIITDHSESVFSALKQAYTYIEAAGGLVYNEKQQMLAIYRLGKWDLPKGKIEHGETAAEAAIREIEEECGLANLTIDRLLTTTYHTYTMFGKKWLKATYWYQIDHKGEETPIPQIEEDIERVVWMNQSDIDTFRRNTYGSILDVLNKKEDVLR